MPTLSKEGLSLLIALQEKDSVVNGLREELEQIPLSVSNIQDGLAREKSSAEASRTEALHLQVERKNKELELAEKEALVRKHQQELNQVKTNAAFKALMTEIDAAKQECNLLQDEILALLDKIEGFQAREKQANQEIRESESKVAGSLQELESKKKDLEQKLDSVLQERNSLAGQVPAEILQRYEQVLKRRKGSAVVPLQKESCGGCHMHLPPQVIVNVKKGQDLVACDSCQRILYLPQ